MPGLCVGSMERWEGLGAGSEGRGAGAQTLLRLEQLLAGSRAEAATQEPCPLFSEPATSSGDSRSGDEDDCPMDVRVPPIPGCARSAATLT